MNFITFKRRTFLYLRFFSDDNLVLSSNFYFYFAMKILDPAQTQTFIIIIILNWLIFPQAEDLD